MKNSKSLISTLFVGIVIAISFWTMMPQSTDDSDAPPSEFSTQRAFEHVKQMTREPHYIGSVGHSKVAQYIVEELKKLGLSPTVQEGYSLTEWGNLTKSKNIVARLDGTGNGKALMLLSHYDSAPHSSSKGAADDATGVGAILEGLRAFLHSKTAHKNDLIILFTDAEELGLNGAATFVTQHDWAKDVGMILNFEARGTGGPSYMLLETNDGNAAMINAFSDAGVTSPVASSLMYSIYKMLPNDTDLTVFRHNAQTQGFNFAFIDDHFNYHTTQDDANHLDLRSLAHQGDYLMPLLNHLGNVDLTKMESADDHIYFNIPFFFIHYPFSWTFPMLIAAIALLFGVVFVGIGKRVLAPTEIAKGFLLMFGALLSAGTIIFFGWKLIQAIYPEYAEIQQGFTYNGHAYMWAMSLLTLAISFLWYGRVRNENQLYAYSVAPLILWTIICLLAAIYLPGAGFFIIPLLCGIAILGTFVATQRHWQGVTLVLSIPALLIFVPLIWMLPIGLGLKILFASAILLTLTFGLMLPVFAAFERKLAWATVCFLCSIGMLIQAQMNSGFEAGTGKPNSLVYVTDADSGKALWATYDAKPDDWTKVYLGENPSHDRSLQSLELFSKYNTGFTFSANAPQKDIPKPQIEFLRDSVIGTQRYLKIKITPNRPVNRYDIFASGKMTLHNLKANGVKHINQEKSAYKRKGKKVLSYYVVDQEPLEIEFSFASSTAFDMELLESSFDLLTNPQFSIPARPSAFIPKPFVLNDAVALRMKIKPTPKPEVVPVPTPSHLRAQPVRPALDTLYTTE